VVQQTTADGKPVAFIPKEHSDFIFTTVPDELPWVVAGVLLVAGAAFLWWYGRCRSRRCS